MPETLPTSAPTTVHYPNDIPSGCFGPCKIINLQLHFDGVAMPSSCAAGHATCAPKHTS